MKPILVSQNFRKIKNMSAGEKWKIVGKDLAGIDVICEDVSKNPNDQSFNIIEINGKPDLYIHYIPNQGEVRNVVEKIIKFIINIA